MSLQPGTLLDNKYRVEETIGRGGFGYVYRATEQLTGESVAVKELVPALVDQPAIVQRFIQEARATLRLTHPRIARTYSVFQHGPTYYLAMEYLPAGSLASRLKQGPLPLDEVVSIAVDLCAALEYAHDQGVIHCDIKPANVLFDAHGHASLADFGIAHVSDQLMTRMVFTSTGVAMGTVRYMAPEQLEGVRDDPRLDLYGLGTVLYEALAGQPYLDFETESTPAGQMRNMQRIQRDPPRPLAEANPAVPASLAAVIDRTLRKAPDERHASAAALREALLSSPGEPIAAPATPAEVRPAPPAQPAAGLLQLALPDGRVFRLEETTLTVGRAGDCEILLQDEQVSRKHAAIHATAAGVHVVDLGSTNGTFINGARIQPQTPYPLGAGTAVQFAGIGPFRIEPASAETLQPVPEEPRPAAAVVAAPTPSGAVPAVDAKAAPAPGPARTVSTPWLFWPLWIGTNAAAWAVASIVTPPLMGPLFPILGERVGDSMYGLLFNLFVGLGQALALRRRIRGAGWWVLAHVLAWFLASFASRPFLVDRVFMTLERARINPDAWWPLFAYAPLLPVYAFGGLLAGLGQALVLRRSMRGAGWWIAASALAYTFAPAAPILLRLPPEPLLQITATVAASVVTGLALTLLFRHPKEAS
jgi:hypothetical protein